MTGADPGVSPPAAGGAGAALARVAASALLLIGAVASLAFVSLFGIVLFLAYAGIGTFLVLRRPGNSIGWLLLLVAWGLGLGNVRIPVGLDQLLAGHLEPLDAALVWSYWMGWWMAMLGLLVMALVFPNGRLPRGRWRPAGLVGIAVVMVIGGIMAISPTALVLPDGSATEAVVPNPYGAAWVSEIEPTALFGPMFSIVVAGIIGMLVRFRRSTGLERVQYRWLVAGLVAVAAGTVLWNVATQLLDLEDHGLAALLIVAATYPALPIAIAIAVLRYRLYEIDRIISRTLSYAVVTGIVVVTFAGTVIVLQAALAQLTQGETLAIAGSTLLVASFFQPIRRRVQTAVDQRFDRSRYDGERMSSAFSGRLRGEVDLSNVTADLRQTVHLGMAPAQTGIWLRDARR